MINMVDRLKYGLVTDINGVDRELKALKSPQPFPLGMVPTNNTPVVDGGSWTQTIYLYGYNGQRPKPRVRHYKATWKPGVSTGNNPVVQIGIGLSQYSWIINWSYSISTGGSQSESVPVLKVYPGGSVDGGDGSISRVFDVVFGYPTMSTAPSGVTYTPNEYKWSKDFHIYAQAFSNVAGTLSIGFLSEEGWGGYWSY